MSTLVQLKSVPKINLNLLVFCLILLSVFFNFQVSQAQEREITGIVTNEDGKPITGIKIVAKGNPSIATISSFDGSFSLHIPSNISTLIFSSEGLLTKEVFISGLDKIIVTLDPRNAVKKVIDNEENPYNEKKIELTGRVSTTEEIEPLAFATVININDFQGTMTDTMGLFYLEVNPSDTIRISTIGYKNYFFSLKDSAITDNSYFVDIKLERDYIELEAVNVRALSWKQFKYQILNMELPEREGQDVEKWVRSLFDEYELAALAANRNPGGIVIPFSITDIKKARQMRKLRMLEHQAEIDRIIDDKFNPQIVKRNTNLKGEELLKFMKWCHFNRVWLLRTNEYDIIVAIRQKFERYEKIKNY